MAIVFDITVVATFNDFAGGKYQRLFDFGNGPNTDAILFGNVGTSSRILFQTTTSTGAISALSIPNAIVDGEEATWRATIDDTGQFTIFKNGAQLGTNNLGTAAIPADVVRTSNLIGESPFVQDDDLIGEIVSIDVTTTLTNGFNITKPEALDDVSSYSATDNSETLDASANTGGISIDGRGGDDTIVGGTGTDTITGGSGANTVTGGDGDDVFVYTNGENLNITDFNTGSTNVGNDDQTDNDFIDLSAFYTTQAELLADIADDGILNQSDAGVGGDFSDNTTIGGQITGLSGLSGLTNAEISDLTNVICFNKGTMILTKRAPRLVEDLKVGDVITTEEGFAKLRWIGKRVLGAFEMSTNPKLRPVRITAGALGQNLPKRDLLVSRQHHMLLLSKIAERMFGKSEVLIPAIKLTELPGIFVDQAVQSVEYIHLLFDQHEIIYAEGTPTESLFTGPEALKSISPEARQEILSIFPEVKKLDYRPKPARFIPPGKGQKQLIARHLKNSRPCIGP